MNKINFHEVFALLSEHEIINVWVCSESGNKSIEHHAKECKPYSYH